MEIEHQVISQITFLNEEVEVWSSVLNKIAKKNGKTGFNKIFNKKEEQLILKLKEKYNEIYTEDMED